MTLFGCLAVPVEFIGGAGGAVELGVEVAVFRVFFSDSGGLEPASSYLVGEIPVLVVGVVHVTQGRDEAILTVHGHCEGWDVLWRLID